MLSAAHLWLASYGRAALVLAIAACLGYPVSRRILRGAAIPFVALLFGLALLSLVVCLLSWLRVFGSITVALVGLAAAALTIRYLIKDVPAWRAELRGWAGSHIPLIASSAVLIVVLLGFSVLSLYPSNGFDATSYHLPLARDLVRHHGLVYDPFIRYSFFPQANEAIYAVMLLLSANQVSSVALEFSVLAAVVLMLPFWFAAAGRRVGAGLVAALLVLASPEIIFTATTAYVDTWTLTFVLVGTLIGLDAVQHRAPLLPTLALAGALVGEAAATKYTGALYGAFGLVGVLVAADRAVFSWRAPAALLAGAAVIALPWYGWTLHTTGDPVYPLATSVFGNRKGLWTQAELNWQFLVARSYVPPGFSSILHRALSFLRGQGIFSDIPLGRSPLSWLLGGGLLGLLLPSAWRDRAFLGSLLAVLLCVFATLNISADPRYFVPAIGILALSAGLAADRAIGAIGRLVPRLPRPILLQVGCWVAIVVGILHSPASYAADDVSALGTPPTTAASTSAYLGLRIPCYHAVEYLNGRFGADYRAWGYICEEARYFARGLLISDVFSVGSRLRIFDSQGQVMPDARTLWRRLQPLDVKWMILPTQTVTNPALLERHGLFKLVQTVGPEYIFRIQEEQ